MTHRVHPKAFRIRRIADWDTRGFYNSKADISAKGRYKDFAKYLEEDFRIREFVGKKFENIGIEKIEIERFPNKVNIIISSARPGLIIGRGGEGIEKLKKELIEKVLIKSGQVKKIKETGKTKTKRGEPSLSQKVSPKGDTEKNKEIRTLPSEITANASHNLRIEIREIKNPWTSASLTAQWIAQQIEKRVYFRKVLKQSLSKITANKEVQGARVEIAGRLGGTEISRREWLKIGKLPRQTIRADIDYAKAEAFCTYGVIGIKVWIYKGEKFD